MAKAGEPEGESAEYRYCTSSEINGNSTQHLLLTCTLITLLGCSSGLDNQRITSLRQYSVVISHLVGGHRHGLDKFLEKIKSDRPKAKPRKRPKSKTPVFATGDCLVFKQTNGNYDGAVVLATDNNPETAYNLVATTRLNQSTKPSLKDFENAETLICNFGQWQDKPDVTWYMPDLFYKDYSDIYEQIGKIAVDMEYDTENYDGKGYLFKPSWTSGWNMNSAAEKQFASEVTKPKPTLTITIQQLTRKDKWWKVF